MPDLRPGETGALLKTTPHYPAQLDLAFKGQYFEVLSPQAWKIGFRETYDLRALGEASERSRLILSRPSSMVEEIPGDARAMIMDDLG